MVANLNNHNQVHDRSIPIPNKPDNPNPKWVRFPTGLHRLKIGAASYLWVQLTTGLPTSTPKPTASPPRIIRAMTVDPAKLRVRIYPDKMLRRKAEPIDLTSNVLEVAERMVELMYESEGIGLAAPQVGLPWRMFVADVPPCEEDQTESELPTTTKGPVVYINPELTDPARNIEPFEEGCLSLPDIRGDVIRPTEITIEATDHEGKRVTHKAAGLLARCWQHEIDHLDGILIIDRMTQASRAMVDSQIRMLERRSSPR